MTPLLPDNWHSLNLHTIARLAPVEKLNWPIAAAKSIDVWVKREDLLHPLLGGNKFYKLYCHLREMTRQRKQRLLTFGGAWSNHIAAVAAIGQMWNMETVGVIRGEAPRVLSLTLERAQRQGMRLCFISRSDYRAKNIAQVLQALLGARASAEHRDAFEQTIYVVPEGGGDARGARGCQVWAEAALELCPVSIDHICVATGTGATIAGVLAAAPTARTHGFLALKGRADELDTMRTKVLALAGKLMPGGKRGCGDSQGFVLQTGYHYGGYAKWPAELGAFARQFVEQTCVPLDKVYTAKLFAGLANEIETGGIKEGSHVLVLHTGGLQAGGI